MTPPVPGATPIASIPATVQYTGTISWSSKDGQLVGKFQTETIYAATINLIPNEGFTFTGVGQDSFSVDGASQVYNSGDLGEVTAIFPPQLRDAAQSLDLAFADHGSINIEDVFGQFPLNDKGLPVGSLKVDRIAVDSLKGIVVLASFYQGDVDNHILLRFNANGSYDFNFGVAGRTLRRDADDSRKPYVLVTTTCNTYTETLDLEIDSDDGILVLLSGSAAQNECGGVYHNFVARYTTAGVLDLEFGDDSDGAIGTLTPQDGFAPSLFVDFTLDDQNRIMLASVSTDDVTEIGLIRFLPDGTFEDSEGSFGSETLNISYPGGSTPEPYRSILIIADNANGYIIAFTGVGSIPLEEPIFFTQLTRFYENGDIDPRFKGQGDYGPPGNTLIVPYFFPTDLAPDGPNGFLMSGTFYPPADSQNSFAGIFRIKLDGTFDTNFLPMVSSDLNPLISNLCINSGLLRNYLSNQSGSGIVLGNFCGSAGAKGGRLKTFSPSGEFFGEFFLSESLDLAGLITKQLIETIDRRVVTLSGARPTKGFLGYFDSVVGFGNQVDWTQPRISRYEFVPPSTPPTNQLTMTGPAQINGIVGTPINPVNLAITGGSDPSRVTVTSGSLPLGLTYTSSGLIRGTPTAHGTNSTTFTVTDSLNETATATVLFVIAPISAPVIVAPTPVPYLRTLITPKLNLKDGNLICTPGTYNTGYTLDGVIQGSTTALFTPSSFTYNLLVNGIAQVSLTVTSAISSNSWNLSAATSGSLIACSVTVSANSLTNTDKSSDNTSATSSALAAQTTAIANANSDHSASQSANSNDYQKALIENRATWRSQIDAIRSNYYAERDRIKLLPSTRATRAHASAALKSYTVALKKSAADYKASQPAALAIKEVANKAALDAKNKAIAKANATYGTFIESIGYGVLIP